MIENTSRVLSPSGPLKIIDWLRSKACLGVLLLSALLLSPSVTVCAQTESKQEELQRNVKTLENDVGTLGRELQEVRDRMSALEAVNKTKELSGAGVHAPIRTNLQGMNAKGRKTATVALIEYSDRECAFCFQYSKEIYPKILTNYIDSGKIRYFWREFPIEGHVQGDWAARASHCAGEQGKFFEMRDSLLTDRVGFTQDEVLARAAERGIARNALTKCLSSGKYAHTIDRDRVQAQRLGVDRTPTFILGFLIPGSHWLEVTKVLKGTDSYERFALVLDNLLNSPAPGVVGKSLRGDNDRSF